MYIWNRLKNFIMIYVNSMKIAIEDYYSKYQTNFHRSKQYDKGRISFSTFYRMTINFKK